jgi:hypothetical protein
METPAWALVPASQQVDALLPVSAPELEGEWEVEVEVEVEREERKRELRQAATVPRNGDRSRPG